MSENQITRTAEVIASEIVSIKETARTTLQAIATGAAVEIGKRLKEAKSIVPYGEWGGWLQTNVDYSERTAQNLMKLAEESARGGLAQMETLSYTQALQLIGLPAADRDAILGEHDVADMSTRELQAVIDEYKAKNDAQQLTIDNMQQELRDLHVGDGNIEEYNDAKAMAADERRAREQAEAARRAAEEKAQKAQEETARAKKEAETATKVQKRLEDELTEVRARQTKIKEPQAPAEVPATVSYVTPPEVQKELDELRERERKRRAAEADAAADMKREGAEYTFRVLYEQFRGQFDKLKDALELMAPWTRGRYARALAEAIRNMDAMIAENDGKEPNA
jgi:hypothetical protein